MRHWRTHSDEGVELNLASMLDMAFQLLAFFILTFQPAPVEGGVALRLPPPMPVVSRSPAVPSPGSQVDPGAGMKTVVVTALGWSDGRIRQIAVGAVVTDEDRLPETLRATLGAPGAGFDQVILQCNATLSYESLMRVIDACTRIKLPNGRPLEKLSFAAMADGG